MHQKRFTVTELKAEVSPGFTQNLWTFNGTAPGPVLHGRVGDKFEITLYNDGTMGHSIDFHAGALAPDKPMRTIAPGEELTYTFTATKSGIWMYHCATAPMSVHIANRMYGAVIIEPEDLPAVDKSFVMVQSEYYLGAEGQPVDVDKIAGGNPDLGGCSTATRTRTASTRCRLPPENACASGSSRPAPTGPAAST